MTKKQSELHIESDAEALPILRLVTNGKEWGIEQRIERTEVNWTVDMVRVGWFRSKPIRTESRKTEGYWRRLCATGGGNRESCVPREITAVDPITFSSREAAVDWVRREFGEAGIRSLKRNAEFRPA